MIVTKKPNIKIVLENGLELPGFSFGKRKDVIGNFIFNTSLVGYQEVLSDPSYNQEIVVMTFPIQGIYGINKFDSESSNSSPMGFVVQEVEDYFSNNHAYESLHDYLLERNIQGISGIDTRYLTKFIREKGVIKGGIFDINLPNSQIKKMIKNTQLVKHVSQVSIPKISQKIVNKKAKNVIFYHFGSKKTIIQRILEQKYNLIVVPYNTKYQDLKKYNYEFIFLSNGPGNPQELTSVVKEIKKMIKANEKICGICLGHQLIALAFDIKIIALKFGHHSINHPVLNLENKKVYITSQNHNYTIDEKSLHKDIIPIMRSLHDNTIEGIKHQTKKIISVQFHPEASPGPNDAQDLFQYFFKFLKGDQNA